MTSNEYGDITKGDVLGIIDYLTDSSLFRDEPGRPFDDDEIYETNRWIKRCCAYLQVIAEEMP